MPAPAGLPRAARLTRAADFAALDSTASAIGGRHFLIRYRTSAATGARCAQAVSRRVHRHAVQRNRIKRQIRESFRRARAQLAPLDLLVIARASAAACDNAALRLDLDRLLLRLPALKPAAPTGTMTG